MVDAPTQQTNLFGETVDKFKTALARYGIWPTTLWDCDMQDKWTRQLKHLIGDDPAGDNPSRSGGKAHDNTIGTASKYRTNGHETYTSVFNPAVVAWLLNLYAPTAGVCLDPFAGGGTRAIMAAKHGLMYRGMEIRQAEVDAVVGRCVRAGVADDAEIRLGDARDIAELGPGDFLLTCPPYYNLEQYDGGPDDLSMMPTYQDFLDALGGVVAATAEALRPGAISCWVVGMFRDAQGGLVPFHHDVARLHREAGFKMKEEVVLHQVNNGAIQRIGNFERGQGHLVRVHEYALVFQRGDR